MSTPEDDLRPPRDPWRPVIFIIILLFILALCASISLLAAPFILRGRVHAELPHALPEQTVAARGAHALSPVIAVGGTAAARPVPGGQYA